MKYIDFHTHITPETDDGAKSVDEAVEMLKTAYVSGAQTVILTPHYRARESIADFCTRRNGKIATLRNAMKKSGGAFPALRIGAEVPLSDELADNGDLKKLCIDGTDLLLTELPFPTWNRWHVQEIHSMIVKQNITPVMAHIERYLKKPQDIEKLDPLISVGVKFQVNASSFLTFSGKRVIKALAREGLICAIGSDCHNMTTRSPDIDRAVTSMARCFGDVFISDLFKSSAQLL